MKNIYILVIITLITVSTFAQKTIETKSAFIQSETKAPKVMNYATKGNPIDTLFFNDFFSLDSGYYNIGIQGATGWMFGTYVDNASGDEGSIEWALGFPVMPSTAFNITGAIMWLGSKGGTSSSSSLDFSIYAIDDSSFYGGGASSYTISCPGTVLGTTTIPWGSLDTNSGWGVASFGTPIFINGQDFACVWNVDDFYNNGDSIGIYCADSASNFIGGDEYVWQLYSSATAPNNDHSGDFWVQLSHLWYFMFIENLAPAVFPIVDLGVTTGTETFFNGIKLGQNFPNPIIDGHTTINYAIENSSNVNFMLWDMNGRLISEINEGFKNAGNYTIILDQKLEAGTYIYSLSSNGKRLTKKMIVQ
jgi:hypothetical protein